MIFALDIMNYVFTFIFILEAAFKIIAYGFVRYIKERLVLLMCYYFNCIILQSLHNIQVRKILCSIVYIHSYLEYNLQQCQAVLIWKYTNVSE